METLKIKIKRLTPTAQLPTKAHATDAGYDLYADSMFADNMGNVIYGTGVAVEIPRGYVGLVFPRSSIANLPITLTNSVGVIDSGYRGEIRAKFKPLRRLSDDFVQAFHNFETYKIGDRIAQLIVIPYPEIEFVEVDALADSDRGEGGYGSSGR